MTRLHAQAAASLSVIVAAPEASGRRSQPRLALPNRLLGNADNCCSFLTQCELHFELQPERYETERARVALVVSHLEGRAEAWATA